ncbi:glycolipid transfer protein 1-like [Amaranthus tricolor]|uniref:glycolipid transfer protein 1-like n=1 Tax=Amaranthus tricolor TaxID=29722 RepID=UPI0025900F46|nr:glycolipid transfer protein 1-like [Amaranthus tricolor]
MEGSLLFTRASEGVKHIRSEDGTILTKPFLDLCKLLLPLIDKFGSQMSCIKADVACNITKLEIKYASNPTKYNKLYSVTKEEVESKIARTTSSCTNALVWLNRAMDFMVQLFSNLIDHPEWSMTQACTDSYKRTLKKWHGWVAISTFRVLIKLAPERKKFMSSVGGSVELNAQIEKLCTIFAPVLEDNHRFLASVGVDDLKAP